jgi:hypothetical protein
MIPILKVIGRSVCCFASVNLDFGHDHYHSAVQNVSKQILEDHLPVPFLKKLRSLCERLLRGLNDDPNGTHAAARIYLVWHCRRPSGRGAPFDRSQPHWLAARRMPWAIVKRTERSKDIVDGDGCL